MVTRSAFGSIACWVCGVLLAGSFLIGCEVHSSRPTDASVEQHDISAPLSEQELNDHGLKTDWYMPPNDLENPVVFSGLLTDGLFLSTQPTKSRSGKLLRVDRRTGKTHWSFDLEHQEALMKSPTVYRYRSAQNANKPDELYFTQLDTVYVLDLKWGDPIGRHTVNFPVSTSVAVLDDRFFAGSDNREVYSVDKSTLVEHWRHITGGSITAKPVAVGGSVIMASRDGSVYRLSPATGWTRGFSWRFETQAPVVADPVAFSTWVFVASTDYKLYCLRLLDGSPVWEFLAEAPIEEAPTVYSYRPGEDYVYCVGVEHSLRGEKHTLFAVDASKGESVWRKEGVRKVVAMGRNTLYVLNRNGSNGARTISGLDVRSGAEKFRLDIGDFRFVPTNLADFGRDRNERGRIYLVGAHGAVQVLSEKF